MLDILKNICYTYIVTGGKNRNMKVRIMKNFLFTTALVVAAATSASAGSFNPALEDPVVVPVPRATSTTVQCRTWFIHPQLFFKLTPGACPGTGTVVIDTDGDGVPDTVSDPQNPGGGTPQGPSGPSGPSGPQGNNGHGNGDQSAPGNSGGNNNAENSRNSGNGNSGNGKGGKKGEANND